MMRVAAAVALLSISVAAAPVSAHVEQAAGAAASSSETTLDGKWAVDIQTGQGSIDASFDLKTEGKKVTGTLSSPYGDARLEGEFDAGKLTFGVVVETPEGAMDVGFAGEMQDDGTMRGMLTGPLGDASWTAARVK